MDGTMSNRKVEVPPNQDMDDAVRDDVLEHSDSPTYEALFIIARPDSQYDYHVTCENFAAVISFLLRLPSRCSQHASMFPSIQAVCRCSRALHDPFAYVPRGCI
jgi:hypothetical protein